MTNGATVREAWIAAAGEVAATKRQLQFLVVTIEDGSVPTDADITTWDAQATALGFERPSSVAEVLMPRQVVVDKGDVDQAVVKGWKLFGRARRRGIRFSGWRETYFERLTGTVMPGSLIPVQLHNNRLVGIIQKLNGWQNNVSAALYAHTGHDRDKPRPRGAPCLQYVQFEPEIGGRLNLIALYRSHDYGNKALGNFVGLARLLTFVANHSGRTVGGITVFSVHPTLGRSKKSLTEYLAAI